MQDSKMIAKHLSENHVQADFVKLVPYKEEKLWLIIFSEIDDGLAMKKIGNLLMKLLLEDGRTMPFFAVGYCPAQNQAHSVYHGAEALNLSQKYGGEFFGEMQNWWLTYHHKGILEALPTRVIPELQVWFEAAGEALRWVRYLNCMRRPVKSFDILANKFDVPELIKIYYKEPANGQFANVLRNALGNYINNDDRFSFFIWGEAENIPAVYLTYSGMTAVAKGLFMKMTGNYRPALNSWRRSFFKLTPARSATSLKPEQAWEVIKKGHLIEV